MKKGQDVYQEPQIITFPGMIVRVYRPVLDDEERARRMKQITKAASDLLLDVMKKKKG